MNFDLAIETSKKFLGNEKYQGFDIKFTKISQKNHLEVLKQANKIEIKYCEKCSLFYALTFIAENYKKTNYTKIINKKFSHNGFMHDCSRNGALNINQIKEMILVSALYGFDRFYLYIEDLYEIEGEPYFGYLRGRYTKAEIKEICEYADAFGIQVIPCIQTLSHLNCALRWRTYEKIRDTERTLLANNDDSFVLIEKMIKTIAENFTSNIVHIGMDEAIDLGTKFFLKNECVDKKQLFLDHLNKVVDLCKKYGLKPMMWGDMFFKIEPNSPADWYDFEGKLSNKTKALIPEGLELVYWDYYHDDINLYNKMFKAFNDTKRDIIFASGEITWIGFAPNITSSLKKMRAGLESALSNKIDNVFMTTWGDFGNECSASTAYVLATLHSLYQYNGRYNEKNLSRLLKTVTGYTFDQWKELESINRLNTELLPFETQAKAFLYNDLLLGLFDSRALDRYIPIYIECKNKYHKLSKNNEKFGYIFKTLEALSDVLITKTTLGKKLRESYKNNDKKQLKMLLSEIVLCKKKIDKFVNVYKAQWDKENKIFGFDVFNGRVGYLLARIDMAYNTIKNYVNGITNKIEEFEQEILPYNSYPIDEPHYFGFWEEMVSVNNIE